MQLSVTTDYAIRATLYLLKKRGIVRSCELSEELKIPKNYILKVTKKLEEVGIVKCYQGKKGGIEIVKTAQEITLWDVIEATENTTKINRCLGQEGYCNRDERSSCPVRKVYSVLQEAMKERLITIKMKDLMNDEKSKNERGNEIESA